VIHNFEFLSLSTHTIGLSIIAAIASNGVIGQAGHLPWDLPGDRRHFRERTWGKPMLMGRKTFESIGHALPGRETIVLTTRRSFAASGVLVAHDPEAALALAIERAQALDADRVALIGGSVLFEAFLPRTTWLELTLVDAAPSGDTFFPPVDWAQWREEQRSPPQQGPGDETSYVFVDYRRISGTEPNPAAESNRRLATGA